MKHTVRDTNVSPTPHPWPRASPSPMVFVDTAGLGFDEQATDEGSKYPQDPPPQKTALAISRPDLLCENLPCEIRRLAWFLLPILSPRTHCMPFLSSTPRIRIARYFLTISPQTHFPRLRWFVRVPCGGPPPRGTGLLRLPAESCGQRTGGGGGREVCGPAPGGGCASFLSSSPFHIGFSLTATLPSVVHGQLRFVQNHAPCIGIVIMNYP